MRLEQIVIENYRGLRSLDLPLSNFVCLTGPNNAGKSSVLQAIALFLSGNSLQRSNYFDETKEVVIQLTFSGLTEQNLSSLIEEHRERIRPLIDNGNISLVRKYGSEGKGQLGYFDQMPKEKRFSPESVAALLKGKRAKAVGETLVTAFPELKGKVEGVDTQGAAVALVEALGKSLPPEAKEKTFRPIPTGGGFSIQPLLPECIYIPAVKDLADDVKTTEASSFGRVLGMVLESIMPELESDAELFQRLSKKLTRITTHEGIEDHRLDNIKYIERTMEKFVTESFKSVKLELEITPPKLQSVLSTARIWADDGAKGPIETKGDGLRRAIVFAILRTYVDFSNKLAEEHRAKVGDTIPRGREYLLLFEEPELFLHPESQRILFDALGKFSADHHVIVTTHSPLFLGPNSTATFVRMSKVKEQSISKPFARAVAIDLSDLAPKDEFQLICFENNAAAFFARQIVLVEGDSDQIVLPYICSVLHSGWNEVGSCVAFVQVGGKGSIQRYRSFFRRFGIEAAVITDLDILLNQFDKLDPSTAASNLRNDLLRAIDATIAAEALPEATKRKLDEVVKSGDLRAKWERALQAHQRFNEDPASLPDLTAAVADFFAWQKKSQRLDCLKSSVDAEIVRLKNELLAELRKRKVFVLSKGVIEDYYPTALSTSGDKPTRAQQFQRTTTTREALLACSGTLHCYDTNRDRSELELIVEGIVSF